MLAGHQHGGQQRLQGCLGNLAAARLPPPGCLGGAYSCLHAQSVCCQALGLRQPRSTHLQPWSSVRQLLLWRCACCYGWMLQDAARGGAETHACQLLAREAK